MKILNLLDVKWALSLMVNILLNIMLGKIHCFRIYLSDGFTF